MSDLLCSLGKLASKLDSVMLQRTLELLLNTEIPDSSLPILAVCEVIKSLPRPPLGTSVDDAQVKPITYTVIPRFVDGQMLNQVTFRRPAENIKYMLGPDQNVTPETVNVVIEITRCFGHTLTAGYAEALLGSLLLLIESGRGSYAARKQAVLAISLLAVHIAPATLGGLANRLAIGLGNAAQATSSRRLYLQLLGSLARSIPARLEAHFKTLVPFLFQDLSQETLNAHLAKIEEGDDGGDFDEVRESALITLEAFLSALPQEMRSYTNDTIAACLRFLTYDPNYIADDDEDEDEDMVSSDDEDDDDELDGDDFDDDDDGSWKVRRCACKALHTLISTRASGDLLESGILYQEVAPALVRRIGEREENVRVEVISSLSLVIRKTGEAIFPTDLSDEQEPELSTGLPVNRKRRRQSSVGGSVAAGQLTNVSGLTSPVLEKTPTAGPRAELARLMPNITKASVKHLKGKLLPTKHEVLVLLDEIVNTQRGGLGDHFSTICPHLIDCVNMTASGSALAGSNATSTGPTLRMAALKLVSDIAKTHSSSLLQPYLSKIVAAVIAAVNDKFYKISSEAVRTAEELVKTITPPRSRQTAQKYKGDLQKLFNVLMERAKATNADAEVRQRAIHALGTLVSRTSSPDGAGLILAEDRSEALATLLTLLKTETGRLAAARALDMVAICSTGNASFEASWMQLVVMELSSQLRKFNRQLRGACISTLKHLTATPAGKGMLEPDTVLHLVKSLLPLIEAKDAYLMGPALTILGNLAGEHPNLTVTEQLTSVVCKFLTGASPTIQVVMESLLFLVSQVGLSGKGKNLMRGLLKDVGVQGEPAVLGQLIGTLLVAGEGTPLGVTLEQFTDELTMGKELDDDTRISLALAVLGEAGMRLGARSTLHPHLFLGQFRAEPDRVSRAAAVALGRAGSTNLSKYLPVILSKMATGGNEQYLLVQSVKEILGQISNPAEIEQHAGTIWDRLLQASTQADNRVACAECIGRLVILEPTKFMPKLQALLRDQSQAVRGMAVQAVRYTLPDSDEAFDMMLKNSLVDMLLTMLQDADVEIRRLSLTTLNSAAHNKPDLILPHISTLMPFVLKESVIKPELIRTIMMGPFKHTVDDGLDARRVSFTFGFPFRFCPVCTHPANNRQERIRDAVRTYGNGILTYKPP